MKKLVKNNVSWVGKVDWELLKFHGDDYSTHKGSTYNSYLIEEEKTVLIDTVWMPFADEFVANLQKEIDLNKIDYIVVNHGEVDHSGSLPALMKLIPDKPIYCTANAVKSLKGQYHQDWDFHVVKTGDKIDVGNGKELIFVEMSMLHWPDSMACYLTKDNILFSNDAFGQHYATEKLFNDLVDQCELFNECIKYYANILTPFSAILRKKLAEVISLGLRVGADDYLPKPFSHAQLTARVKSLLRRYRVYQGKSEPEEDEWLVRGPLRINRTYNEVEKNGQPIDLPELEYQMLLLMASHAGRIFSAQNLYESVWNEPYLYSSNGTVMVHIRKLRVKLEDDPQNPKLIQTVWGKGYRFG